MSVYYNLVINRRIKVQEPLPDKAIERLEEETMVEYPFDCEELDGTVDATVEDAN